MYQKKFAQLELLEERSLLLLDNVNSVVKDTKGLQCGTSPTNITNHTAT